MGYVLITPLKNEEENLMNLKKVILNQTLKPTLWVIVDSGSTDNTFLRANSLFDTLDWVHIIKQNIFYEKGYGHLNFSQAINEGYSAIQKICKKGNIKYNYIGKMDATPILHNKYFETLLLEMEKDNILGITCGIQNFIDDDSKIEIKPMKNISLTGFNDIRLYRKKIFEELKGYPLMPSPDTILLIKAMKRNWNVKVIDKTYFHEPRMGGTKIGIWNGAKLKGKSMYILGYHPVVAVLSALETSRLIPPHYQVFPLIWGYLLSFLKREQKVSDEEIREYYGKKRLKEVIYSLKT